MTSPRRQFADTATALLDDDPRAALVWAEISGQFLADAAAAHPDRVVNVGIREQLLVNVGAGMALTGLRPIVHTFGSFLVERAFEQVKLGFGHQGVGGVLVGSGGSFDIASGGRTHQVPGDLALLDTLPDITLHTPGTAREVDAALRQAVAAEGLHYVRVVEQVNTTEHDHTPGRFHVVRRGAGATVVAIGPVLDAAGLRAVLGTPEVVVVEPWSAGTSARFVADALRDVPHRLLSLGVARTELRRYGTPEEHIAAHGLDARGVAASLAAFLDRGFGARPGR